MTAFTKAITTTAVAMVLSGGGEPAFALWVVLTGWLFLVYAR